MANSPARAVVDVGSVIADTYKIEALIGEGGMGSVFLASHTRLPGKRVAIKLLHAEITDEEVLARFRREAEIASKLGHPNIVQVHDFNLTSDGTPYLVLEYLEGETLAQRLTAGPMSLEQVIPIVRQVGSALAAAHREGIVHRDLKPQNIFLVPTDVGGHMVEVAKILDFGISKIRGSKTVKTQESTLLGTPQYMAPEQARGHHDTVDARTDVFALGAIVYEMLAGHPAFSGENIPEVVFKVVYEQPLPLVKEAPSVPPKVIAAVDQAMAKPATDRFSSVNVFVEALTGQPLSLYRAPSQRPTSDGSVITPQGMAFTGQDAFAQTMGSLDPDKPRSPILPDALAPTSFVSAKQETLESQSPGLEPADDAAHAATEKSPPPAHMPRPRSAILYVVIGIAAAAVAIVVMVVAMRDRSTPTPPERSANAGGDAAVRADVPIDSAVAHVDVDATAAVVSVDAGVRAGAPVDAAVRANAPVDAGTVASVSVDAGTRARPRDAGAAVPDEPDHDDETNKERLKEARQALAGSDYATANLKAQSIINSPDASPRQRAFAAAIAGILECVHDDIGAANGWMRRIPGKFPAARQQLASGCAQHGHPEVTP